MPDPQPGTSFAELYDTIRGDEHAFRSAQIAFLREFFSETPALLLDAGCGTSQHAPLLAAYGYRVIGLDISPAMLAVARANLSAAGLPVVLVHGDLTALPFASVFSGILCLESPLAYLMDDAGLVRGLDGFRRALRPGGMLVVDVFDYVGTFGEKGLRPRTTRFAVPWGHVDVWESHRYDRTAHIWEMRQAFTVVRDGEKAQFTIRHRLRIRPADAYAAALERAGFTVERLLPFYPATPPELRHEQRIICVARAR